MDKLADKLIESSPKYKQLAEIIKSAICSGRFGVGDKIPSTSELMDEFGVSAHTVRQSIGILENEGFLKRRQGMGTFVISQSAVGEERARKVVGCLVVHLHPALTTTTSSLVHHLESELAAKGYSLMVAVTNGDPAGEEKRLRAMVEEKVCGILWETVSLPSPELIESLRGIGIPFVFMNTPSFEVPGDCVCIDNRAAALRAVETMISFGHKRIAFASLIGGPYQRIVEERLNGYRDALVENGIPFDEQFVVWEEYKTEKLGFEIVENLLRLREKPAAIFATHDLLAIGITAALRERGYSIPQDMALMGFDNVEAGKVLLVPLTTVAPPVGEMARKGVELLLSRVAGEKKGAAERVVLPTDIVVRASCAPVVGATLAVGVSGTKANHEEWLPLLPDPSS